MIAAAAVVAALIAESLAFYTAAELLAGAGTHETPHAIAGWLFALLGLLAFGLMRAREELELPPAASTALAGAVAYVAIVGALRISFEGDFAIWDLGWIPHFIESAGETLRGRFPVLFSAVLAIALWARSSSRAAEEIELELMPRAVGVPFLLVTTMVVLGAATDRSGEVARAGVAFYAFAVVALACSQLAMSGATIGELRAGGITAALLGATVGATIVCVIVFGVLFGWAGPTIGAILARVVEIVLTIVLTPFAWLIETIMRLLFGDQNPFMNLAREARQPIRPENEPGASDPSTFRNFLNIVFRMFGLVIVLGLVAGAAAWYMRLRRHARRIHGELGDRASAGSATDDLRALFGNLFHRGQRTRAPGAASAAERLYLEVLDQAHRSGRDRQPGDTPEEFAPALRDALQTPVTDDITAAFEQSRYAGREPDPRALADLEQRWRTAR